MAKWYIKEFGNLTGVSVRTLHHYDKIDLLKPSIRQPNGYRLYSEADLLRQQQIIALKSFGFQLSQIKTLLAGERDLMEHFSMQSTFLKEKAEAMLVASTTLDSIISDYSSKRSIDWKAIIKLIEGYQMIQELEKTWAGKAFNSEELKEYAEFKDELKTRFTPLEHEAFEKSWAEIVSEIRESLDKDPQSSVGIAIGKRCMELINSVYGEHHKIKRLTWEKGFKEGHVDNKQSMTPEMVSWLDGAIESYYRECINTMFDRVGIDSDEKLLESWNTLIGEMYGSDQQGIEAFVKAVLSDSGVSNKAKEWIKKL